MEKKDIAMSILLSIITCGIYTIFWMISINDDVVTITDKKYFDQSGGTVFLFTLLTCGIYGIYWVYKMGECLREAGKENLVPVSNDPIIYVVLAILNLGLVNYALLQSDLNKLIDARK